MPNHAIGRKTLALHTHARTYRNQTTCQQAQARDGYIPDYRRNLRHSDAEDSSHPPGRETRFLAFIFAHSEYID